MFKGYSVRKLVLFALVFSDISIFAQPLLAGKNKEKVPNYVTNNESERSRRKRIVYGTLGITTSPGVAIGYYLDRNLAAEARVNYYLHGNGRVYSVGLKKYWGNSFFTDIALGQ